MNSNMQTNTEPAANRYWKSIGGTERRKRRKEERGKRKEGGGFVQLYQIKIQGLFNVQGLKITEVQQY